MTVWRLVPARSFRAMPWRNGGGTTWEIARGAPEGAGETHWHWRFSLAEIAADGPFSAFPHVDRLLTVVAGEGIVLTIDGSEPRRLTRGEDIQFPGEAAIGCGLVAGVTRDLNLMVDRRVARLAPGGDGLRIVAGEGDTVVLYALEEVALRVEAELIVVEAGDAMIGGGRGRGRHRAGTRRLGAGRAAGLSMMGLRVAVVAGVIMAGLMGCASSHTKPRHDYGHAEHKYSHGHAPGHSHSERKSSRYGHHHGPEHHHSARTYHRPPPQPGRTPDGRYVLPGGLESVCAGGTPPPCQ